MTATESATASASGPPPRPAARSGSRPPGRFRRNWYRLAIPFGLLTLVFGVVGVAHHSQEASPRDPETLSPTGTGPDGSSRLAELLTQQGVQIDRAGNLEDALAALDGDGDAVVFLPKPTFAGSLVASVVASAPGDHRIVLVAPRASQLWFTDPPVFAGSRRWAATAVRPGCDLPEAVAAGRATALRGRYQPAVDEDGELLGTTCYRGGLVRTERAGTELIVVGANDPFRNRRIDEHGNATLAVGLLSAYDRVIWVDRLGLELDLNPELEAQWPELRPPSRPDRDRSGAGFESLVFGYPPGVLAGMLLAVLVAALVAVARSRRLGPPVGEPLPVVVPAAESVAGRGRLYQRTGGRGVALAALRAAAIRRLLPAVGLPAAPPPGPEAVVAAVADRAGQPPGQVHHTLYGPEPADDDELGYAAAALDHLVAAVTRENPRRGEVP